MRKSHGWMGCVPIIHIFTNMRLRQNSCWPIHIYIYINVYIIYIYVHIQINSNMILWWILNPIFIYLPVYLSICLFYSTVHKERILVSSLQKVVLRGEAVELHGHACTKGKNLDSIKSKSDPSSLPRLGNYLVLGPKRVFCWKFKLSSFWIIFMSNFTVQLTNSGPGMVLRLPRCALIFKLFSGDWKMVGIRKPNDFFQFFQCHPSREETHPSSEVQVGSRLYCCLMFLFWHQMVHFYSEPGSNN